MIRTDGMRNETKRAKADIRGRAMAWLFLVCALLGSLLAVTLRTAHYRSYWGTIPELRPSDIWRLRDEDRNRLFEAIPRALNGDLDALRLRVRDVDGQESQAFTEREIAHMADVAALYRLAKIVLCVGTAMLLALAVRTFRRCGRAGDVAGVAKGAMWGALDFFLLLGAVALWAMIDFRSVFWAFHQVAFTNDLWLLDPSDRLIQMMPQSFFESTVTWIGLCWALCVAVWLTCWRVARKKAEVKR